MVALLVFVMVAGALVALARPELGLGIVVLTGFGQELARKAIPGQSAFLQGLVVAMALATFLGAYARNRPSWWKWREWRPLYGPVSAFLVVLVVQAGVSYFRTGTLLLPMVGLVAYSGPLVAVATGSWLGFETRAVYRVLTLYLVLAVSMATGILLVQTGVDWEILKPLGGGLIVYTSERISLPSGFFRSPEVASWHCATGACVAILLATRRKKTSVAQNALLALAFAFLSYGVLAAGRRKGILEIVVFLAAFVVIQGIGGQRLGRLGRAGVLTVLIAGYVLTRGEVLRLTGGAREAMLLRERDTSGSSLVKRLGDTITVLPAMTRKFGPLGLGLGTLTQGSRYFGADLSWGIDSESGPYRLAVELGLAGVGVVTLILFRLVRLSHRRLKGANEWDDGRSLLVSGLVAILVANAAVFLTAHQIFGDPFVFLWLGLMSGFAFVQIADAPKVPA